MVLSKQSST